ncbi:ABC transporter substrate-binding protein [Pseudoxanthomonas wuyuanensis]
MSNDPRRDALGPTDSGRVLDALARGASRREVLKLLAGVGLALAGASSIVTLAEAAVAARPRYGGRVRVATATSSIADTLDPAKLANQTDYARSRMLYSCLTRFDGGLTPQPALAERFETTDARHWRFHLRRGVSFHDGKPLHADDVVFSLMRHKEPATVSKAKIFADQIESVRALSPTEVEVRLHEPNADLPVTLATFWFAIVPAGMRDFNRGIGTGPFALKEFKRGLRSLMARNPNYWRDGRPYVDEVEMSGLSDEGARVNALLSGDLDLVAAIDPRSVRRVEGNRDFRVFRQSSGQYSNLAMRQDMAPGRNRDFVRAMQLLFDRKRIAGSVALGNAIVANDHPIHPSNRFWFDGLPQRELDLDKARYHFQRSGLGSAPISVVASPVATYTVEMTLALQQTARKIGMNLDLRRMPPDGYWSNHWGKSAVGWGNVNPRPNADAVLTQFFQSGASGNDAHWQDPKFDQLLLAARSEIDEAKRKALYADMQVMIHEQGGVAIPLFISSLDAHNAGLKGLSTIPVGGLMGYEFAEHVWWDA